MIFLDTSFIVSFYNEGDENHMKAIEIMYELIKDKYGDVAINDYIFNECATVLFARLKNLEKTVIICERIKKIRIFRVDEKLFEESWQIFKNQKNTKLSFTDCSILAIMKKEGIKNIVTFDGDFLKVDGVNVINWTHKKEKFTNYKLLVNQEELIQLLITYKESFLDSFVNKTIEMWEIK